MHSSKAQYAILVTELGIVTEVRLLQPEKAPYPILVTELGIVTDVKLLQLEKAYFLMLVTEYAASFTFIEDGILMSPSYLLSPFVTSATLPSEIKL